jgi:hypothetical protein
MDPTLESRVQTQNGGSCWARVKQKKKEKKGVELEQELLIQDWLVYTLSYKIKKRKKDFVRCAGESHFDA